MKKSFLLIIIIATFIGCNPDTENIKLNQGVNFKEINKIKKKSFNFDKKNNYSNPEKTKDSALNKNDLHQGCTAPCCSEGK
ncbi:MAG: hypothetical protein H8E16_05565 [Flavobacteriales bacterium]|nr:hypothetical protein [Flavobacteriales bacterium]